MTQPLAAAHEAITLLASIPGVSPRTAEGLLAEIGPDMTRFPSAKPLASWAGRCPGHDASGGQRLSGKPRQGRRWRRQTLVEVAQVASKTRQTSLAAHYRRMAARRGKTRALMAVGHTMLRLVSTLLPRKPPYRALGATSVESLDRHRGERRLVPRLERLGYQGS